jgi:AcrR family transcriptional regulator
MPLASAVNRNLCYYSDIASITATPADRRSRRRQETIEEILGIAADVMTEQGVNGLSLSEVARRLGVKPPSIYKYFDSIIGIYDALFERGQRDNLEAMRAAMEGAAPGLDALAAGLEASGRWAVTHPATAQLLFWRPVPSFEPSPEAMAPSFEMVGLQRQALADAAAGNQLGPGADSDEALFVTSVFVSGVIGQAMANEPGVPWGEGIFSPLLPKLVSLLAALYPPKPTGRRRS